MKTIMPKGLTEEFLIVMLYGLTMPWTWWSPNYFIAYGYTEAGCMAFPDSDITFCYLRELWFLRFAKILLTDTARFNNLMSEKLNRLRHSMKKSWAWSLINRSLWLIWLKLTTVSEKMKSRALILNGPWRLICLKA